jgi:hypothetical protein
VAGEADWTLYTDDEPIIDENKSNSGIENDAPMATSSSNMAAIKIAEKTILDMADYRKKSTLIKGDHKAYHSVSWLNGGLESSISEVNVPTVDG